MDLDKALRAMQHCEAWANSVQAACLFANKPYTERVLQVMTRKFLDDLEYDPGTLEISVPTSIGDPLLAAVEAYEEPSPEPVPELLPAEPDVLATTLTPIVQTATQQAVYEVLDALTDTPPESEEA